MKVLNIKFRKTKKVYPFLINEFQNFQKGDHVIVDTIRGEQIGIVLGVANKLGMELEENDEVKIREVKRKLTEKEVEKLKELDIKADEAYFKCKKIVKDILPEMNLVIGEYTFDESGKLIKKEDQSEEKEYEGDVFAPKSAKLSQFNPNLYLAKGTYIGCSLNTRLVSTIKGGISCTVSEDVYSDNGVTLLIEKGSKITGSYRNGQMNDGMDRIFVVWQEIKTPNQVIIPVSSGASDELGGAGIQGYVDHHWLERFGSAILLSIIDDATNVALNGRKGDRSNSNVDYTENSREATQQMANTALEKFVNIQPTLYKNHGDIVGVYVNRDIDFSNVYKLRVRKGIRK